MRTALFWAVTQQLVIIPFRRFGTTYRSRLRVSLAVYLALEDGARSLRNIDKELALLAA